MLSEESVWKGRGDWKHWGIAVSARWGTVSSQKWFLYVPQNSGPEYQDSHTTLRRFSGVAIFLNCLPSLPKLL
jgi:hypothetical protein